MHKPLTLAASAVALALAALAPLAAQAGPGLAQPAAQGAGAVRPRLQPGPGGAHRHRESGALLGQSIVVENKPGASGNIGTYAIANAKPDGYTFGVSITGPLVNNTLLFDKLPYAPPPTWRR